MATGRDGATAYVVLAPEFTIGPRLGAVELALGVKPLVLVALSEPTYELEQDENLETDTPAVGFFKFETETLAGSTLFLLTSQLHFRYNF